jgi:hypothetical protein
MTSAGAVVLGLAVILIGVWTLNLVRRGRLYVGYGIVMLALIVVSSAVAIVPVARNFVSRILESLFPGEPVAVLGLSAVILLLIYLLEQITVMSHRVATLTQELAIRRTADPATPRTESAKSGREPLSGA